MGRRLFNEQALAAAGLERSSWCNVLQHVWPHSACPSTCLEVLVVKFLVVGTESIHLLTSAQYQVRCTVDVARRSPKVVENELDDDLQDESVR
jgi:hypothetical protein